MLVVLPLLGGFSLGLAVRRLLQAHFATAFRANTAVGVAVLAFLAGWSFEDGAGSLLGLGVLLGAQITAVLVGSRLFGRFDDGPLLTFGFYGNAGFWAVPVAAATLGTRAAVVLATYDLLTQPRLAIALRLVRSRAPIPQAARTAVVDYAPMSAAVAGLLLGRLVPAPPVISGAVVVLATVLAAVGATLLGIAWPRQPLRARPTFWLIARAIALHLALVPAILLAFARLYGYCTRLAACAFAASIVLAVALLPLAVWLGHHLLDG